MQEEQVAEAPVQEAPVLTPDTGGTEPQEQNTQQDSPEDIQEATSMGWVPKEKFRGDPNMWRPAGEFVRRGREILPIIQKRERGLQEEVRSLKAQMEERDRAFEERTRRLDGMARVALERQRAQLESAYEAAKRKAVADGDIEAYDRLSDEGRRAVANFNPEEEAKKYAPPVKEEPEQQIPQHILTAVDSWVASNPWFDRDPELRKAASEEHGRLLKREKHLSIEENLERTLQFVMEEYPEKFAKARPRTQQPHSPAVEGGGRQPQNSNGRARGWNDLPPEAKQAGMNNINRDKLWLPIPKGVRPQDYEPTDADIRAGQAAYAKFYWEQEV